MAEKNKDIKLNHRFLDEAGDTSFYGKGKKSIIGSNGVSSCFIIGMVKFKQPLTEIRNAVADLQNKVANDPFFDVISIRKKKATSGYYFHATDDLPEVRKLVFDFIKQLIAALKQWLEEKQWNDTRQNIKARNSIFMRTYFHIY